MCFLGMQRVSPPKAACLYHFLGRQHWSEVRSIFKDQPPQLISGAGGRIHAGLDDVLFCALNWPVLCMLSLSLSLQYNAADVIFCVQGSCDSLAAEMPAEVPVLQCHAPW